MLPPLYCSFRVGLNLGAAGGLLVINDGLIYA